MVKVNRKVTASAVGGGFGGTAAAILIIWVMKKQFGFVDADFDPEFSSALGALMGAVVGFASGWLRKLEASE